MRQLVLFLQPERCVFQHLLLLLFSFRSWSGSLVICRVRIEGLLWVFWNVSLSPSFWCVFRVMYLSWGTHLPLILVITHFVVAQWAPKCPYASMWFGGWKFQGWVHDHRNHHRPSTFWVFYSVSLILVNLSSLSLFGGHTWWWLGIIPGRIWRTVYWALEPGRFLYYLFHLNDCDFIPDFNRIIQIGKEVHDIIPMALRLPLGYLMEWCPCPGGSCTDQVVSWKVWPKILYSVL